MEAPCLALWAECRPLALWSDILKDFSWERLTVLLRSRKNRGADARTAFRGLQKALPGSSERPSEKL